VVIETFSSTGSGVIVDPAGLVLTNHHVTDDAKDVIVKLYDGRKLVGKVVDTSVSKDLALVKVKAIGLRAATLARSGALVVGEAVVAIGAPLGLEQTVTSGILSAVRTIKDDLSEQSVTWIQTDAAINSGNSGGPLLNLAGEVVGINTQKASIVGVEGLGFAVSIQEARTAFPDQLADR